MKLKKKKRFLQRITSSDEMAVSKYTRNVACGILSSLKFPLLWTLESVVPPNLIYNTVFAHLTLMNLGPRWGETSHESQINTAHGKHLALLFPKIFLKFLPQ